jgi:SAM-dependent methyltransferase
MPTRHGSEPRQRRQAVRDELRRALRSTMTFNAPLSEQRAAALVAALPIAPGHHVLDLGCGWGELLLRVVAAHPGTTGTGADLDRADLDRGRALAAARGLTDRVDLVEADITGFDDQGAVVICVGASHAWGGATGALAALRDHLEPGGVLLYGDAFWERPPSERALEVIGELPGGDDLTRAAASAGFRVESAANSTLAEWDAFEASSSAGLEVASLDGALELAAERRTDYEDGYRGSLGFAWLVLVP